MRGRVRGRERWRGIRRGRGRWRGSGHMRNKMRTKKKEKEMWDPGEKREWEIEKKTREIQFSRNKLKVVWENRDEAERRSLWDEGKRLWQQIPMVRKNYANDQFSKIMMLRCRINEDNEKVPKNNLNKFEVKERIVDGFEEVKFCLYWCTSCDGDFKIRCLSNYCKLSVQNPFEEMVDEKYSKINIDPIQTMKNFYNLCSSSKLCTHLHWCKSKIPSIELNEETCLEEWKQNQKKKNRKEISI